MSADLAIHYISSDIAKEPAGITLGGFLTNCCVESTMRTGYEKGYRVVTLTDCTAAVSEEEQRLAVEKNYPMFSRPLPHGVFLAELGGGT